MEGQLITTLKKKILSINFVETSATYCVIFLVTKMMRVLGLTHLTAGHFRNHNIDGRTLPSNVMYPR